VVDGPYDTPAYDGFYNDTAALADGKVAAVYTKAGADTDGPTDVFVAIRR
jgi:hypothetical protein